MPAGTLLTREGFLALRGGCAPHAQLCRLDHAYGVAFRVEGKQDGLWKRYYGGTGQLYDVGKYVAGKKKGVWKIYTKSGKLVRTDQF